MSSSPPGEGGGAETGAPSDAIEAHVRGVSVSGTEGNYTFSVSVESDDIDCSQFCNFWEIVSEGGQLIYRRQLVHSHTDENGTSDAGAPGNTFTRSGGPVEIPADQNVIVRAHMNTGGYEGEVMSGSVDAGFKVDSKLATDFAADLEYQQPLSQRCDF